MTEQVTNETTKAMEVRIEVRYFYCPENKECCRAVVRGILPASRFQHGLLRIERPFVSKRHRLLGDVLQPSWGYPLGEHSRYNDVEVTAENWNELKEKVSNLIEEVKTTLLDVVRFNREMESQQPQDECITLLIP